MNTFKLTKSLVLVFGLFSLPAISNAETQKENGGHGSAPAIRRSVPILGRWEDRQVPPDLRVPPEPTPAEEQAPPIVRDRSEKLVPLVARVPTDREIIIILSFGTPHGSKEVQGVPEAVTGFIQRVRAFLARPVDRHSVAGRNALGFYGMPTAQTYLERAIAAYRGIQARTPNSELLDQLAQVIGPSVRRRNVANGQVGRGMPTEKLREYLRVNWGVRLGNGSSPGLNPFDERNYFHSNDPGEPIRPEMASDIGR